MKASRLQRLIVLSLILAFCASCAHHSLAQSAATPREAIPRDPRFPASWWAEVPSEGAPAWEILPQEAGPGEVILSKRNELGIFSNFAATPFTYRGKKYASVEGFWQMMLYPESADDPRAKFPGLVWKFTRDEVANMVAFEAKNAGKLAHENMKIMGIDWASFEGEHFPYRSPTPGRHHDLIVDVMKAKLDQNPEVRRLLLMTGDLILKPDHKQSPDDPPEWRYFEIWMQFRKELQR